MPKASHAEVDYGPGMPNGEHCAVCANYLPDGHCKLVVDPILPDMWCLLFEEAKDMATTSTGPNNAAVKFRGKASQEMPLQSGSSRKTISKNISELHSGDTYANTESKYGKADADKQAEAIALKKAGKSRKSRRTRRRNAMKRGLVSESQAKRYLD